MKFRDHCPWYSPLHIVVKINIFAREITWPRA
jgi:hypothetical protein